MNSSLYNQTQAKVISLSQDSNNWVKKQAFTADNSNFSEGQLSHLFRNRKNPKYKGLSYCFKLVGKTGYVNKPILGMWMSGLLENMGD